MTEKLLIDVPLEIETGRLTIRSPRRGDGPLLFEAIRDSRDRLAPWFPWTNNHRTPEESEAFIWRKHIDFLARTDMLLLLFLKGTGTLIGSSGLHYPDWSVPSFEIGYWVRSGYEGNGYITEAVRGITDIAFNNLDARRVVIRCDVKNEKSAAVARRAGFELEGTHRCISRHHRTNQLRDLLVFARIRRDPSVEDWPADG